MDVVVNLSHFLMFLEYCPQKRIFFFRDYYLLQEETHLNLQRKLSTRLVLFDLIKLSSANSQSLLELCYFGRIVL